ncbi:hypothetical protein K0M31_017128 [Melipona bicolor]|uniref:Uncharacterized protein n=1 Tax=Melipona bicolor TaxID=60889 RepID=A0AA40FDG1_9HYME|nr:hypothetical protein K0M31_017128 [Melipona bicolor]
MSKVSFAAQRSIPIFSVLDADEVGGTQTVSDNERALEEVASRVNDSLLLAA